MMSGTTTMTQGNFDSLARNYSKFRVGYSQNIRDLILQRHSKPVGELEFVDVGAGTGLWSRMVHDAGVRRVTCVEPSDPMRAEGERDCEGREFRWLKGTGEDTTLPSQSADLLTMASSFHWVNYDQAMEEFSRVLRPGGQFVALWNPRFLDDSPLLLEIEAHLHTLVPNLRRRSSGRSGITEVLHERLRNSQDFEGVVAMEAYDTRKITRAHYLGLWESVNDIRSQAGEETFGKFLDFVRARTRGLETLSCTYLTRAWSAVRR